MGKYSHSILNFGNIMGKYSHIILNFGNIMGNDSHIVHNFGNLLGKCSHDIHNVVIRKKVATFPQKKTIITSWESTASQKYPKCGIPCLSFFPIIGNFPIYFPTGNFEKFPVIYMPLFSEASTPSFPPTID